MAQIKVTTRVEVTDVHGEEFIAERTVVKHIGDNRRFWFAEAQQQVNDVGVETTESIEFMLYGARPTPSLGLP